MNRCLNKKNLSFFLVMLIFSVVFWCDKVFALVSDEVELTTCDISKAYIEWSNLSDEEKKGTIMPPICDSEAMIAKRLKKNVRSQFNSLRADAPTTWDIRTTSNVAQIRNQDTTGSCWAFSAATTLEIYAKKHLNIDTVYSAMHIEYSSTRGFANGAVNEWGYNRTLDSGGNAILSNSYFANQLGPVDEEKMSFEDYRSLEEIELSTIQIEKSGIDVNNTSISGDVEFDSCSSDELADIKKKVMNSGSVEATVYMNSRSNYYNSETASYYYNGTDYSNHAVTIVGWDDNYSLTNFNEGIQPSRNGAWLVQNSYGTEFGNDGYFYVSYDDTRICSYYAAIEEADVELEDNAYIYDKLGHNTSVGYRDYYGNVLTSAYGLSVFTKGEKNEILKEVTMGTRGPGSYKIYYMEGNASSLPVTSMTLVGEGKFDYYGYYTHKFDNPILIDDSVTTFSIAIYVESDYTSFPLPAQAKDDYEYLYSTAETGKTYVSYDGKQWGDLGGSNNLILSLKAFTDDVNYNISIKNSTVSKGKNDNVLVDVQFDGSNLEKEKFSFEVFNSKNVEFTEFNYAFGMNEDKLSSVTLDFYNAIANDDYILNIYYDGSFAGSLTFHVNFDYGLSSDVYLIDEDEKIVYITSPTSLDTFMTNIKGNIGNVTIDGKDVQTDYVGTGMYIDDFVIILNGDVTGDGLIKVNDVMKISKYTVEGTGLEKFYCMKAADVTGDGLIKVNDVMKISKYTVEGGSL